MPTEVQRPITDVAVGLITAQDGRVLLGDRPQGKPWAGWWELPGGKLEAHESVPQALARELDEEIAIKVQHSRPWLTIVYRYPTTTVRLHVWQVTRWSGEPTPMENQQLAWVDPKEALQRTDLLPAAYPLLRAWVLPRRYLISHVGSSANLDAFMAHLERAHRSGIDLVQWREPRWQATEGIKSVHRGFEKVRDWCQHHDVRLLVNSCHPQSWWAQAHGVHLRATDALATSIRPELRDDQWLAVSTHNPEELARARELEADFAVLGPVLPTASHPDAVGLGWEQFRAWAQDAGVPVLALGGQSSQTLLIAQEHGAHGIAGIRHLVPDDTRKIQPQKPHSA